jgi:membrane protein implicated in regulation of membrane protease activity
MIRLLRILGFALMATGVLVILTWLIRPLRALWPWLRQLPLAIQIGLVAAAAGLLLLISTLLWERWEERAQDRSLREDS